MMNRRKFHRLLSTGATAALVAPMSACTTPLKGSVVTGVDCHAHVFMRDLPMPDRRRAPSGYDAPPEDYLRRLDANGLSHGVLVQPSFLGTDNSYLVSALRRYPDRLRGIAAVSPVISAGELDLLQQAGVVGIRLNLVGLPTPDLGSADWSALLGQLKRRDWQVEVHRAASELKPVIDPLLSAGVKVVVDHFGRPDEKLGVDDPGFRYLMSTGSSRRVWVKLSGAYRNGPQGEAFAVAAMPLLTGAFGVDRLVWGSDWPHTLFEKTAEYAHQRQLLDQWLPEVAARRQVLQQTPASLFRFS